MTPEIKLWRSVIIQAITDALGLFSEVNYQNRKIRQQAVDWMSSEDIKLVSDYADTSKDYIVHLYSRLRAQRHLKLRDTEDLLKNAFLRPRRFTIYSNEGDK